MQHKKLSGLLFLLFVWLFAQGALAAQFKADMIEAREGAENYSKIVVKDARYRIDTKEESMPIVVLVDEKSEKTWIIVPERKTVVSRNLNDMANLIKNPFQAFKYMARKYENRMQGRETINGYKCKKFGVYIQGKEAVSAWVSVKLNFPLKIINKFNGMTVELKNIREVEVKNALFQVPKGYRESRTMPVAPPEWAKQIPSSPVLSPPFKTKVSAGSIIRIKPAAGSHIALELKNDSGERTVYTLVGFKNHVPIKKPSFCTYSLMNSQRARTIKKESPAEADEIIIRVKKGVLYASARLIEVPPNIILKKYRFNKSTGKGIRINPKKAFRLTVTDIAADGKPCLGKIEFFVAVTKKIEGGTQTTNKKILEQRFNIPNGNKRIWRFPGSKAIAYIQLQVDTSPANVRLEQPEKGREFPSAATKSASEEIHQAKAINKNPKKGTKTSINGLAPASVIFILDASGSMWGQIQGKAKIAIAKKVMISLIDKLPSNLNVGFMVYGHRRKGDCNDIELMVPVGKVNPMEIKSKIRGINPKGKTPLSAAVQLAAKYLQYTKQRAMVVLVSDGLETCNDDPCGMAQKLAMKGIDFTVHVIGFDMSVAEQAQLRCLADRTGGLFLSAANANELQMALMKTVKKVEQPPPEIEENPTKASLRGPRSAPAGSRFTVKWQGPGGPKDFVAMSLKGSKDTDYVAYAFTKSGNPVKLRAPGNSGDYELRYVYGGSGKVLDRTAILVTPVKASVILPPSVQISKQFQVTWHGPGYENDMITLARVHQSSDSYLSMAYVYQGNPVKLLAPADPGTYQVRYILGHGAKILAKASVKVKGAGAQVHGPEVTFVSSEFEVTWEGPAATSDLITVARSDQGPESYLSVAYARSGSPVKLRAPVDPGTYELRYILGQGPKILATGKIKVKPVKAEIHAPGQVGVLDAFDVSWKGPGYKEDLITIAKPGSPPTDYVGIAYARCGSPLKLRAPDKPGTYEVRYILGYGAKILDKVDLVVRGK